MIYNTKKTQGLWAVLLTISILFGCGGGTSSTSAGGEFTSGYERSLALNTLTSEESQKLCEKAESYIKSDDFNEKICRLGAVITTIVFGSLDFSSANQTNIDPSIFQDPSVIEECRKIENECLKNSSQQEGITSLDCESNRQLLPKCSAKVELYENCVNETFQALDELFAIASCSNIEVDVYQQKQSEFEASAPQTPACVELNSVCPGLFSSNNS